MLQLKWSGTQGATYTEASLRKIFSAFGDIEHLYINNRNNRAAVQFSTNEEAQAAISAEHKNMTATWPDTFKLPIVTGKPTSEAAHNKVASEIAMPATQKADLTKDRI